MDLNHGVRTALWTLALVAGLSSVAAASPKAIKKCGTIDESGSYIVVKNLTASGDCLVIAADFVTIDLDGFTIAGPGTGSGVVGDGNTRTAITIRNGMIRNFEFGIRFNFDGISLLVEGVTLVDNSSLGAGGNDQTVLRNNIVTGSGLGLIAGARSVVTGNTVRGNTDGMQVGSGSTIIGNTAGVNTRDGFQIGNGSTVVNNAAHGNTRYGFLVECASNLIANVSTLSGTDNLLTTNVTGDCNSEHNLVP